MREEGGEGGGEKWRRQGVKGSGSRSGEAGRGRRNWGGGGKGDSVGVKKREGGEVICQDNAYSNEWLRT